MSRQALAVAQWVREQQLWMPGETVAMAVSGGADSLAMAALLMASAGVHGGVLSVVTVDHQQHPESAAVCQRVLAWARSCGLEAQCLTLELRTGQSEGALRSARYAALEALSVDRIALGHHQDDQVETALMAWLRGHGTRGAAGMPVRRGRFVRPVLHLESRVLRAYAEAQALPVHDDPANDDPAFLRNRVRHQLVPLLERLRPGATGAVARAALRAAEDEQVFEPMVQRALMEHEASGGLPRDWVAEGPRAVVRRTLVAWTGDGQSGAVDAILAAAQRGSGVIQLTNDRRVVVSHATVAMVRDG